MSNWTPTSEVALLTSIAGQSNVNVADLVVLVSLGPPISAYVEVTELYALESTTKLSNTQVTEVWVLATYVTGPRSNVANRVFGFTFDGHQFFILTLGNIGTYAYDLTTKQWAQFDTQGYNGIWNFEHGVEWNNGVYGGDNSTNQIWKLNPTSFLDDDFRPIQREVTAIVSASGRETIRTGALIVDAQNQTYVVADTPSIQLAVSDDAGATLRTLNSITLSATTTQIDWRSLGTIKAPGRVFYLTDNGGLTRIDGANLQVAGEKPQGQGGQSNG